MDSYNFSERKCTDSMGHRCMDCIIPRAPLPLHGKSPPAARNPPPAPLPVPGGQISPDIPFGVLPPAAWTAPPAPDRQGQRAADISGQEPAADTLLPVTAAAAWSPAAGLWAAELWRNRHPADIRRAPMPGLYRFGRFDCPLPEAAGPPDWSGRAWEPWAGWSRTRCNRVRSSGSCPWGKSTFRFQQNSGAHCLPVGPGDCRWDGVPQV